MFTVIEKMELNFTNQDGYIHLTLPNIIVIFAFL